MLEKKNVHRSSGPIGSRQIRDSVVPDKYDVTRVLSCLPIVLGISFAASVAMAHAMSAIQEKSVERANVSCTTLGSSCLPLNNDLDIELNQREGAQGVRVSLNYRCEVGNASEHGDASWKCPPVMGFTEGTTTDVGADGPQTGVDNGVDGALGFTGDSGPGANGGFGPGDASGPDGGDGDGPGDGGAPGGFGGDGIGAGDGGGGGNGPGGGAGDGPGGGSTGGGSTGGGSSGGGSTSSGSTSGGSTSGGSTSGGGSGGPGNPGNDKGVGGSGESPNGGGFGGGSKGKGDAAGKGGNGGGGGGNGGGSNR